MKAGRLPRRSAFMRKFADENMDSVLFLIMQDGSAFVFKFFIMLKKNVVKKAMINIAKPELKHGKYNRKS